MNPSLYDRWGTYVHESGDALVDLLRTLVPSRDKSKSVCLILGQGFDPRMLAGLQALSEVFTPAEIAIIVLVFNEGLTSPSRRYDSLVQDNLARLKTIIPEAQTEYRSINMFSTEGRRITSRSAAAVFQSPSELQQFTHIFVDVSSLPRSVFFPVVAKLLYLLDEIGDAHAAPNLFVLVSESAALDGR